MAKKSKMFKGATVSEANETMAPITETTEEIKLEPEEIGVMVYIYAPKHCKSFRKLAAKHLAEGKVSEGAALLLPDGQVIRAGATVKTAMRPELKRMLVDGVFLAGKAPRKEGKGARKAV